MKLQDEREVIAGVDGGQVFRGRLVVNGGH